MRICLSNKATRELIAGVMLLAFAVRAFVPQGFMPAGDRPFSLQICPEGLPAEALTHAAHHHHGGPRSFSEHCVFGTACANGPPSHPSLHSDWSPVELVHGPRCIPTATVVRLVYLPHLRGPPPVA
jgi:hypothetical protein